MPGPGAWEVSLDAAGSGRAGGGSRDQAAAALRSAHALPASPLPPQDARAGQGSLLWRAADSTGRSRPAHPAALNPPSPISEPIEPIEPIEPSCLGVPLQDPTLVPGYDGALLRLAVDLTDRFLPAFDTPTGIPLSWVNLRHVRGGGGGGLRAEKGRAESTSGRARQGVAGRGGCNRRQPGPLNNNQNMCAAGTGTGLTPALAASPTSPVLRLRRARSGGTCAPPAPPAPARCCWSLGCCRA